MDPSVTPNSPTSNVEALAESMQAYAKTSIELAKLQAIDTSIRVVTSLVSSGSVMVMMAFFFLFVNIGLAMMIGDMLGKVYYGFFIIAGGYLLIGIVFQFTLRKWISKPISTLILTQALQS